MSNFPLHPPRDDVAPQDSAGPEHTIEKQQVGDLRGGRDLGTSGAGAPAGRSAERNGQPTLGCSQCYQRESAPSRCPGKQDPQSGNPEGSARTGIGCLIMVRGWHPPRSGPTRTARRGASSIAFRQGSACRRGDDGRQPGGNAWDHRPTRIMPTAQRHTLPRGRARRPPAGAQRERGPTQR